MRELVSCSFQIIGLLNQPMSKLRLRAFGFPDDDRKQIKCIKPLLLVKPLMDILKKIRFEVVLAQVVFGHTSPLSFPTF